MATRKFKLHIQLVLHFCWSSTVQEDVAEQSMRAGCGKMCSGQLGQETGGSVVPGRKQPVTRQQRGSAWDGRKCGWSKAGEKEKR